MTTARIVVIGCLTVYLQRHMLVMGWLLYESIALLAGMDVNYSAYGFDLEYHMETHLILGSLFCLIILPYIYTHNFFKATSFFLVLFCALIALIYANIDQPDFNSRKMFIQATIGALCVCVAIRIAIRLHSKVGPVAVYHQWSYIKRPKDWLHILWTLILSPVWISYLYLLHPSRIEEQTSILDYPATLLILDILSGSILVPFVEELIYRRLFFSSLRQQTSLFKAILITSLVFSLAHLQLERLVPTFILGVALALIYERTQSLIVCTAVHGVVNALNHLVTDLLTGALEPELSLLP